MFLRALRICSPEFIDEEFDNIFRISERLKYPRYFIESSLQKARKTFYSVTTREPFNHNNLLVLPYNENMKNVPRFCQKFDINVVFKFSNTLRNMLIKNSPSLCNGCVYEIPCKDCNCKYIGQTGKGLATRIKQHKYSIRSGQMSNALFLHRNNDNHVIDWDSSKVLVNCNNVTIPGGFC